MNDTNQENQALERRIVNTAPACVMLPGHGFLVALNPDSCLPAKRERASLPSSASALALTGHLI
jgi:hypothetical protein